MEHKYSPSQNAEASMAEQRTSTELENKTQQGQDRDRLSRRSTAASPRQAGNKKSQSLMFLPKLWDCFPWEHAESLKLKKRLEKFMEEEML